MMSVQSFLMCIAVSEGPKFSQDGFITPLLVLGK